MRLGAEGPAAFFENPAEIREHGAWGLSGIFRSSSTPPPLGPSISAMRTRRDGWFPSVGRGVIAAAPGRTEKILGKTAPRTRG